MKVDYKMIAFAGLVLAAVSSSVFSAEMILTLPQAEAKALQNSFTSRKQHCEISAMEWQRRNAVSSYLPSVNYNLNYLRLDRATVERANAASEGMGMLFESLAPIIGLPPGGTEEFTQNPNQLYENSFSHEIMVSQPLFNGGAELFAIGLTNAEQQALVYQHRADMQRVVLETRRAYFDVIAAQLVHELSEQSLSWARENLKIASVRFQNGAVPQTDLLGWEIEVAKKESELQMAEVGKRSLLLSLYHVMGYEGADADLRVNLQDVEFFKGLSQGNPGLTEYSIENNPTLLSVKAYTELTRKSKNLALSQFLPKVNAFFSYRWDAWEKLRPHDTYHGWSAGASLTVPLFSGFRNSSNYQKTKYEHLKNIVSYEELRNQLQNSLQALLWNQEALEASTNTAQRQIGLMERQLELMQQRYEGGLVNLSQLLEAELGLRQVQIAYAQNLFNTLINKAEIKLLTGNLESMQ
ncbi:Outer membrane efflux protein [Chitinispirillum alkaliphilum]|nr:Outer membrane efflux protein [Chitinispirillum alkaliphilum]